MTIIRCPGPLDCDVVEVPQGLRLLAADGRSFLLRGLTLDRLAEAPLPAPLIHTLGRIGLLRTAPVRTVAVVGSGRLATDAAEAVRGVARTVVVELSDSDEVERPGGGWQIMEEHSPTRLTPDLVVICPNEPLGLRPVLQLCRERGVPAMMAWCGPMSAWAGPVLTSARAGCQNCLDMAMARRDPLWLVTAAAMTSGDSCWAGRSWIAGQVADLIAAGCDETAWAQPTWSSWTPRAHARLSLDPHPECWWCAHTADLPAPKDSGCSTASSSAA
ncbi:hypothetical protein [Acidipropionibacterium virtanenii]|nr:hypothetical protein [Acidipropionibacterium virtanenii]